MRAAMGCPAVPVVLGELGYFLDVADPRFVHAAAVNAGMVRLAAGDVASNPTPTPTPSPSPSPSPSPNPNPNPSQMQHAPPFQDGFYKVGPNPNPSPMP